MGGMFSSGTPEYKNVSPAWQTKVGNQLAGEFMGTSPATTELSRLLNPANFDVASGQEWKGLREQSQLEEGNALDALSRKGAAGGWLYSDPYQRATGDTMAKYSAARDTTLGGLQSDAQKTQLSAVQSLMNSLLGYKPDTVVSSGSNNSAESMAAIASLASLFV
jgi:hypothetical protein